MIEWHIEIRKIKDLRQADKNPRTMTKTQSEQLKKSITKFGLIDKPFINRDNTIIGGHQRLTILKQMGVEDVEVYVPSRQLTPDESMELNLRHNQNTGSWDWDVLANEFEVADLLECGFNISQLTGEEPEQKAPKKPWAKFEFTTQKDLSDCLEALEEVASTCGAKLKVRI